MLLLRLLHLLQLLRCRYDEFRGNCLIPAHAAPYHHPAPSAQEISLARASGKRIAELMDSQRPLALKVGEPGEEQQIELPASAIAILTEVLEATAAGRGITIIPENAELTTAEAASILHVSRPYLIKLLDERVIPHRLVGKHRRVLIEDVLNYKRGIDAERESVLARLTADAQENDMGYERE